MIFFGNQAIVVAIDIAYSPTKQTWEVFIYEGTQPPLQRNLLGKRDAKKRCWGNFTYLETKMEQEMVLIFPLLHAVNQKVTTPVIASGGVDNTNT